MWLRLNGELEDAVLLEEHIVIHLSGELKASDMAYARATAEPEGGVVPADGDGATSARSGVWRDRATDAALLGLTS